MGVAEIISILLLVVKELPGAIETTTQLVDLGKKLFATVNGREPTEQEVADLEAQIQADVAEALKPLPPAEPGDPDYKKPVP